jgi:hypothetical protein
VFVLTQTTNYLSVLLLLAKIDPAAVFKASQIMSAQNPGLADMANK